MAARDTPPADQIRAQYVEAGTDRYERIRQRVEQALEQANVEDDTAADLAAIITSWLVAQQLQADVRPQTAIRSTAWVDDAIDAAYRDGIQYARQTLHDADADLGLNQTTVDARLDQPRHARTLDDVLASQREVWRDIADDLEREVGQAVREAAEQGATRRAISERVKDRIEHVAEHRARLTGRTEPAEAFHRAAIEEWRLIGVREAEVNWETMADARVCTACRAGSANSPYSLDEAAGLLPHHPVCRCFLVPVASSLDGPRR